MSEKRHKTQGHHADVWQAENFEEWLSHSALKTCKTGAGRLALQRTLRRMPATRLQKPGYDKRGENFHTLLLHWVAGFLAKNITTVARHVITEKPFPFGSRTMGNVKYTGAFPLAPGLKK